MRDTKFGKTRQCLVDGRRGGRNTGVRKCVRVHAIITQCHLSVLLNHMRPRDARTV